MVVLPLRAQTRVLLRRATHARGVLLLWRLASGLIKPLISSARAWDWVVVVVVMWGNAPDRDLTTVVASSTEDIVEQTTTTAHDDVEHTHMGDKHTANHDMRFATSSSTWMLGTAMSNAWRVIVGLLHAKHRDATTTTAVLRVFGLAAGCCINWRPIFDSGEHQQQ